MSISPFINAYYGRMVESLHKHEEKVIMDIINDLTKTSKKGNIQLWKDIIKEKRNNGNNSSNKFNK